jgi:hypothetical protein
MTRSERRERMLTRPQKASQASICDGDYYHSEDRLYCVEQTHGERVVLEDCASGELLDVSASDLDRLTPTLPQGQTVVVEQRSSGE